MKKRSITESDSLYDSLESMSTRDILENINREDQKVAQAVQEIIPLISDLVDKIIERFEQGGRLIYIGAGTSGRLGILDASEIPPTFGMSPDRVLGLIAGGDRAIRKAVENAETACCQSDLSKSTASLPKYEKVCQFSPSNTDEPSRDPNHILLFLSTVIE